MDGMASRAALAASRWRPHRLLADLDGLSSSGDDEYQNSYTFNADYYHGTVKNSGTE